MFKYTYKLKIKQKKNSKISNEDDNDKLENLF